MSYYSFHEKEYTCPWRNDIQDNGETKTGHNDCVSSVPTGAGQGAGGGPKSKGGRPPNTGEQPATALMLVLGLLKMARRRAQKQKWPTPA